MGRKIFAVLALLVIAFSPLMAQQGPTDSPSGALGTVDVIRGKVRTWTGTVLWKNAAGTDTTVRLFTAAAALADTGNTPIFIGGASSITMIDSFGIAQDSALVRVFAQFSNDKNIWVRYLPGTGVDGLQTVGSVTAESNAAFDSSGAFDTSYGPGKTYVHAVAIDTATGVSHPGYYNWMRLIAGKHVSAATDSMRLKTSVTVHWGGPDFFDDRY